MSVLVGFGLGWGGMDWLGGFGLRAGPPSGACRVRGSVVIGTICANETANHGSLPSECALVSGGPALRRQSRGGSSAWRPERPVARIYT